MLVFSLSMLAKLKYSVDHLGNAEPLPLLDCLAICRELGGGMFEPNVRKARRN